MRYVIAYDVADGKRRRHLAELLLDWGHRVQESVFECELSAEELAKVRSRLEPLIRPPADRCHVYALCADCVSRRRAYGGDLEPKWGAVIVV